MICRTCCHQQNIHSLWRPEFRLSTIGRFTKLNLNHNKILDTWNLNLIINSWTYLYFQHDFEIVENISWKILKSPKWKIWKWRNEIREKTEDVETSGSNESQETEINLFTRSLKVPARYSNYEMKWTLLCIDYYSIMEIHWYC